MENQASSIDKVQPEKRDRSIGKVLLDTGKINARDAEQILRLQKETGVKFGEAAIQLGLVTQEDIARAVSTQFDYHCLSSSSDIVDQEVVTAYRTQEKEVESMRLLRSQLALRWFSERKALVLTSASPAQGVSRLIANLAVVFSQMGEKVLLIDANMREPRQHQLFKLKGKSGLSDILADRAGLEVIEKIESLGDLSILSAGTTPPNPLELIARPAFTDLINKCINSFDVVLIDTPPALNYGDAQTIISRVGGALIVARRHYETIGNIEKLKDQIAVANSENVGLVLNDY